jgi:hypothetical protein
LIRFNGQWITFNDPKVRTISEALFEGLTAGDLISGSESTKTRSTHLLFDAKLNKSVLIRDSTYSATASKLLPMRTS